MQHVDNRASQVEAELRLPIGQLRRVRNAWSQPINLVGIAPLHHLELTLLPVPGQAQACFPDHWGADRFERFGAVFLLPAGHRVHARSECREQHSVSCSLDPQALQPWLGCEPAWTEGRLRAALDLKHPALRATLLRIDEELRHPGFASATMLELLAGQAAVELFRHLQGIGYPELRQGRLSARCLQRIDERLADLRSPPTLSELAGLCHLSVRQLTRAFRAARGQSIGAVIAARRIEQARALLANGQAIKAVAAATGFRAASNFAAAFLRETGETPSQYRDRISRRVCLRPH